MDTKNYTQVLIDGKIYTLGGTEDEAYLQKAASYVNEKIATMYAIPGFSKQSADYQQLMLLLNIADDYFKAKKQAEIFEQDLQQKDQEMYDLKHELISLKMQIEEAKKAEQEAQEQKNLLDGKVKELEKELDELLK